MSIDSNIRVLVVDDESTIASTLAAILRLSGYRAESFTNPLEALSSTMEEPPDLLISDVVMPQMSGVELAIQIRALCPLCKILLFSGQAERRTSLRRHGRMATTFNFSANRFTLKIFCSQFASSSKAWSYQPMTSHTRGSFVQSRRDGSAELFSEFRT